MSKQETWTAEQYQQHFRKKTASKMRADYSKYGNVKTEADGIQFDSKKEADYYGKLKIRVKAGEVVRFERQTEFEIRINGELVCKYIADFVEHYPDGSSAVIDVKSEGTRKAAIFRLKEKLMRIVLGIVIEIK